MPPDKKLPRLLLNKARQDLYVLEKMAADERAPIEVFGFHAQQAVEKILKAILALNGIEYPRTHRLIELADMAIDHGVNYPNVVEDLVDLTPYAVEFRYDVMFDDGEDKLDKSAICEDVKTLCAWLSQRLGQD